MNTLVISDAEQRLPPFASLLQQRGTYALNLEYHGRSRQSRIGAIGRLTLYPGTYIYVGSAAGSGGLAGRLRHHLRGSNRPRWHVDYLNRPCHLAGAWITPLTGLTEHRWTQRLARLDSALLPMPRFGASDCRRCKAHLIYFAKPPGENRVCHTLATELNMPPTIYVLRAELDQLLLPHRAVSQSGELTSRHH